VGMGFLDTGAYVLNNYGMRLEQVSVMTVLSSLYAAVTVGFAATILGEKISRKQWMGIIGIFTGIVFISR
jgi:drug/metabolite transporter (DMT)-like permease